MKRSPLRRLSRKREAQREQYQELKRFVADRANDLCEAQVSGICVVYGADAHHILPRSHQGQDTAENLLFVCRPCHGWIHEHPQFAYDRGLLRRSWEAS